MNSAMRVCRCDFCLKNVRLRRKEQSLGAQFRAHLIGRRLSCHDKALIVQPVGRATKVANPIAG